MTGLELTATARAGRAAATLRVHAGPGAQPFTLEMVVQAPWHVYAPGAPSGLPVRVEVDPPMELTDLAIPPGTNGELAGRVMITGMVTGARPGCQFSVRTQACAGQRCEPPVQVMLTLTEPLVPAE